MNETSLKRIGNLEKCKEGAEIYKLIIDKALNKMALNGIEDWSHVWLVYVKQRQVQGIVAEIVSRSDRSLILRFFQEIDESIEIVDIKPYHFLEYVPSQI